MPTVSSQHSDFQKKVCFCCFTKPQKDSATFRPITGHIEEQIKDKNLFDQYGTVAWDWLPTCICEACRKQLSNPDITMIRRNYNALRPPQPKTRAHGRVCCCSVCYVGRLNGKDYLAYRAELMEAGGARVQPFLKGGGQGKQAKTPREVAKPVLVCSLCNGPWSPGIHHPCDKQSRRENIVQLLQKADETTKQRVLSSTLKEVFDAAGASTSGGSVSLATGGKPITATFGTSQVVPPPRFSSEVLNRLQLRMRASDRGMRILDNFLRIHAGRECVETDHAGYMVERNNRLKSFFNHEKLIMSEYYMPEGKKKKEKRKVPVPVAFCTEVEGLATEVMMERGLDANDTDVQLGVDDGQGFLKVYLFVYLFVCL